MSSSAAQHPSDDQQPVETWETLRSLISDLELLLTADADELRSLDELRRARQDIKTVVTGREADARRVIQGKGPRRPRSRCSGAEPGCANVLGCSPAYEARVDEPPAPCAHRLPSPPLAFPLPLASSPVPVPEMLSRAQHASATAAQYDPTVEDVRRRIEAVDARARALAAELDALRGSKDVSQRKLHDLAHTMAALKTQQAAAVADAHAQVPRVKCVPHGRGPPRVRSVRARVVQCRATACALL